MGSYLRPTFMQSKHLRSHAALSLRFRCCGIQFPAAPAFWAGCFSPSPLRRPVGFTHRAPCSPFWEVPLPTGSAPRVCSSTSNIAVTASGASHRRPRVTKETGPSSLGKSTPPMSDLHLVVSLSLISSQIPSLIGRNSSAIWLVSV